MCTDRVQKKNEEPAHCSSDMVRCAVDDGDTRVPRPTECCSREQLFAINALDFIRTLFRFRAGDEVYLISINSVAMCEQTDAAILRGHWRRGDSYRYLSRWRLALYILPKPVRRVPESQFEMKPNGVTETAITM